MAAITIKLNKSLRASGLCERGNLEVKGDCFVGRNSLPPRNDGWCHCEQAVCASVAISKLKAIATFPKGMPPRNDMKKKVALYLVFCHCERSEAIAFMVLYFSYPYCLII